MQVIASNRQVVISNAASQGAMASSTAAVVRPGEAAVEGGAPAASEPRVEAAAASPTAVETAAAPVRQASNLYLSSINDAALVIARSYESYAESQGWRGPSGRATPPKTANSGQRTVF